jgi:hypothetical protein
MSKATSDAMLRQAKAPAGRSVRRGLRRPVGTGDQLVADRNDIQSARWAPELDLDQACGSGRNVMLAHGARYLALRSFTRLVGLSG